MAGFGSFTDSTSDDTVRRQDCLTTCEGNVTPPQGRHKKCAGKTSHSQECGHTQGLIVGQRLLASLPEAVNGMARSGSWHAGRSGQWRARAPRSATRDRSRPRRGAGRQQFVCTDAGCRLTACRLTRASDERRSEHDARGPQPRTGAHCCRKPASGRRMPARRRRRSTATGASWHPIRFGFGCTAARALLEAGTSSSARMRRRSWLRSARPLLGPVNSLRTNVI